MVNRLRIREIRFGEREVVLRLPFKFGMTTLERTPQVFVSVHVELEDGRQAWGETAELLVPKWFDKSPALTNEQNLDQLRSSLRLAAEAYGSSTEALSAFDHFAFHYQALIDSGGRQGLPPLVASFGGAELDKAILDGLCKATNTGFQQAMRENLPGIGFSRLAPDLDGFNGDAFLRGLQPRDQVAVRHTVGMLDPLVEDPQRNPPVLEDGLPETLTQVIGSYGHRYFKIKVSGQIEADLSRLQEIARILDTNLGNYSVTLDGNEQFRDSGQLLEFWEHIKRAEGLAGMRAGLKYIEQPIHRDSALDCDLSTLAAEVPLIIDESDGSLDAFIHAQALGYSGVSSKACKGLYKSLINAARCCHSNGDAGRSLFLAAEDLTCQAGLALQQDLALIALLGMNNGERNGHHYVRGMAGAPEGEQRAFHDAHPDLYTQCDGRTCLAIRQGRVQLGSLNAPGFASGAAIDWSRMSEMRDTTERAQ